MIIHICENEKIDGYFNTIIVSKTRECISEMVNKIDNKMEIDFDKLRLLMAPTGDIQEISTKIDEIIE